LVLNKVAPRRLIGSFQEGRRQNREDISIQRGASLVYPGSLVFSGTARVWSEA